MKICQRCNSETRIKLRRIIAGSGVSMTGWYCLDGGHWANDPVRWLSHERLRAIFKPYDIPYDPAKIPTLSDNRRECEVCGAQGAEWHHWFPSAIRARMEAAGENMDWEWEKFGVYLCLEHHRQWHEAVTWYIPTFAKTKTAELARKIWEPAA